MDWTHRLRLRNVRMLLSLAQTRNISHSAAMLNTTQPGLSKWLKDLEQDIGLPLFERHARGLIPTQYGEVLIEHARRLDAQLDRASGDMAALRERFAPDPASLPEVVVELAPLSAYEALLGARAEEMV